MILGEPGCGKTTTLYRLLLDAAKARLDTGQGPLPVLLPLADYREYTSPEEFVAERWRQEVNTPDLRERFEGRTSATAACTSQPVVGVTWFEACAYCA